MALKSPSLAPPFLQWLELTFITYVVFKAGLLFSRLVYCCCFQGWFQVLILIESANTIHAPYPRGGQK